MKEKKRLGELLIEANLIAPDQLQKFLKDARKADLRLGQYLIRNGIVAESQIVEAVSKQLKIERYKPHKFPINIELSKLIPVDMVQKYQVAPLDKKGFLLKVAMIEPMDLNALDAIEVLTNLEVEALICTEQELNALVGAMYGKYSSLGGLMDNLEVSRDAADGMIQEKSVGETDVELSSLHDMAEDAPVIRLVNTILTQAIKDGASDLHISPDKEAIQVRFRVDGKLHNVPPPPKSMFLPIVSRLKILSNMDIATARIPQDGRFSIHMGGKEINVRASTLPTIYGENLVLRLLDMSAGVSTLDQLGVMPEDLLKLEPMIHKPYGMILSTGPTGSGKSTTLYSILKKINNPDTNIITLEDPVEYRVEGIRQVQLNRKAGMTFASGLKSILRQDPDVIMVGEIRDQETATIAVQAALTGHRVLSTVHTNDAAGAVTRFMDMGIEPFLVSSVMLVSIAQRLIRKICPNCREEYDPPQSALDFFNIDRSEDVRFERGAGCFNCMDSGYKGRTGIYEVLVIDEMIQDMVLKKKPALEITREAKKKGVLRTLKLDAAAKIRKGVTTIEEAMSAVMN